MLTRTNSDTTNNKQKIQKTTEKRDMATIKNNPALNGQYPVKQVDPDNIIQKSLNIPDMSTIAQNNPLNDLLTLLNKTTSIINTITQKITNFLQK